MLSMHTAIQVTCATVGTTLILWYSGPLASFLIRSYLDYMCPPPPSTLLSWGEWLSSLQAIRNSTAYATGCGALKEQTSYRVFKFVEDYSESWILKGAAPLAFYHLPNIPGWFKAGYQKWFGNKKSADLIANMSQQDLVDLYGEFRRLNSKNVASKALTKEELVSRLIDYVGSLKTQDSDESEERVETAEQKTMRMFCTLYQIFEARQHLIIEQGTTEIAYQPSKRMLTA